MSNHCIYPAVIEQTEDNYCLYFPDLPGCVVSGNSTEKVLELAQKAAQEYLRELEHDRKVFPTATSASYLSLNECDTLCMVEVAISV